MKKDGKKTARKAVKDANTFTRFGAFDWKFECPSITGEHSAYGSHHCSVTEGEGYLRIKPHRTNGTARQTKLQRTINEVAHNNLLSFQSFYKPMQNGYKQLCLLYKVFQALIRPILMLKSLLILYLL